MSFLRNNRSFRGTNGTNNLEKFEKRSIPLFIARAIDTDFINQFEILTSNYLNAKTLEDKEVHWQEWLSVVRNRYWENESLDGSFELKLFFENLFYENSFL